MFGPFRGPQHQRLETGSDRVWDGSVWVLLTSPGVVAEVPVKLGVVEVAAVVEGELSSKTGHLFPSISLNHHNYQRLACFLDESLLASPGKYRNKLAFSFKFYSIF